MTDADLQRVMAVAEGESACARHRSDMSKLSAGLLMFRKRGAHVQVFLVHPGGPFWKKKDEGAWSIPKGESDEGEDPLAAAKREFEEETGIKAKWRIRSA
jgi:predicted NUDIX family NTP pyrophosphohydrolase